MEGNAFVTYLFIIYVVNRSFYLLQFYSIHYTLYTIQYFTVLYIIVLLGSIGPKEVDACIITDFLPSQLKMLVLLW